MHFRPWLLSLALLTAACVASGSGNEGTPTQPAETNSGLSGASSTTTPLGPPPDVDVLVATTADEFDLVSEALDAAVELWASRAPDTYAYRLRIECECVDRGTGWVRVFDPDWPDEVPLDVELLHGRIRAVLDQASRRIEVAFDSEMGYPVWFAVDGSEPEMFRVDEFHEITPTATPFDGSWRFVEGEIDGRRFGNPTTGLIFTELRHGYVTFPIDCNDAGGSIDVYGDAFGVGPVFSTAVGCVPESEEGQLFSQALQTATTIGKEGAELVLSGEDSLLRLVPLERPERRGELDLTAAGETLLIEADGGRLASVFTISSSSEGWSWPRNHPGRSVLYTLRSVDVGSGMDPTWSPWEGEIEVPSSPSASQAIVIPDDIYVGDFELCSPYWSGEFFCYDLPVRPASSPWYVTAGADGVVLHDADTTSQTVWEAAARIAFWFDDLLIVETPTATILTVADNGSTVEISETGSRLLDANETAGSNKALIFRRGETVVLDIDSGDETVVGSVAIEGRLAGDVVVLQPSPNTLEARSATDGAIIWRLSVDPEEMITSVTGSEVRLDRGHLSTDDPMPFWQYLETRIVDTGTGEVVDEYEFELAIPLEGDQVTEKCTRAELRDGLLLCPQPDGRFATIEVEGGDQRAIAGLTDVIATYVR